MTTQTQLSKPKFGDKTDFSRDVEALEKKYLLSAGIVDPGWWNKMVILVCLSIPCYVSLYFPFILNDLLEISMKPWLFFLWTFLWGCMGFLMALMGFNIAHDALHGAIVQESKKHGMNWFFGLSFNIFGANDDVWYIQHNIKHHTHTNMEGYDGDISFQPFLRLTPHQKHYVWQRWQHVYAWILYGFAFLIWIPKDIFRFFSYGLQKYPKKVLKLCVFKALYVCSFLMLPMILMLDLQRAIGINWLVMVFVMGISLTIVFMLAHAVLGVVHPKPCDPKDARWNIDDEWKKFEVETSCNFATKSKVVTWLTGGLNYQVLHHVFPKICHTQYPNMLEEFIEICNKHNVQYNEKTSFRKAIMSHYQFLKLCGRGETAIF